MMVVRISISCIRLSPGPLRACLKTYGPPDLGAWQGAAHGKCASSDVHPQINSKRTPTLPPFGSRAAAFCA
jgi:hypothetical protein